MPSISRPQPTCADRIAGRLAGRTAKMRALASLAEVYDDDALALALEDPATRAMFEDLMLTEPTAEDIAEAARERMYEMPLAVDTLTVHVITLSTGGPADSLEVATRATDHGSYVSHEIVRITYVFQDWFDGARQDLAAGSPEFVAAETFATHVLALDV